jgi:hypothetical protein
MPRSKNKKQPKDVVLKQEPVGGKPPPIIVRPRTLRIEFSRRQKDKKRIAAFDKLYNVLEGVGKEARLTKTREDRIRDALPAARQATDDQLQAANRDEKLEDCMLAIVETVELGLSDESPTKLMRAWRLIGENWRLINDHDSTKVPSVPEIPPLDLGSGKWVTNKEAAKMEGLSTRSLADYRKPGHAKYIAEDKMSGIDKDGRMWRRQGTKRSHPYYYVPSLISSRKK